MSKSIGVEALPESWLEALSVFPLPQVVFFPGTVLPLHIFEPRYRAMMRAALDSGQHALAVTMLRPGFEVEYEGQPRICTVCTVGRFDTYEELPDGRFNVALHGIARVELEELPMGALAYRRAKARVLDGTVGNSKVTQNAVTTLLSTAALVASNVRKLQPGFSLGVLPDMPPSQITDTLADRLIADATMRQRILETLDVRERMRLLTEEVAQLLGELETRPGARERRGPLQ